VPRSRELAQLLALLDQAYDHHSWHGTNLRGSLRRVSPRLAAWRPAPGRHNIWELVVHAAYWKYAVWRRITGTPRGSFPLQGSDWFRRPEAGGAKALEPAWRADVALLARTHRSLREAAASLSANSLHRRLRRGVDSPFSLLTGAAAHDLYHAGQIQLLKRLGAGQ
jgi:hypothetical protein